MEFEIVTEKDRFLELIDSWNNIGKIAVDFEEESNLHMYGEHLALIQVYDGKKSFVIDVVNSGIDVDSLCKFFMSKVQKIWFDFGSDGALVAKKYGKRIENVLDIRAYALALGETGSLDKLKSFYLGISEGISKRKLQQHNWMKRPLDKVAIDYALSDVKDLFSLEDVLYEKVKEKHLEKEASVLIEKARVHKKPKAPWTKITDIRHLSDDERRYLRTFFSSRDAVARRFNVPSSWILGKKELISLAKRMPESIDEAIPYLSSSPDRFRQFLKISIEKGIQNLHNKS